MNSKLILGGLIGGLILFIWQFLSWSMLNLHGSQLSYTSSQDAILECLKENNLSEGSYFLPTVSPDIPSSEHMDYMEKFVGKPWATISYHNSMKMNMGMNMFRAFVVNVVAVLLLCYLLLGNPNLNFKMVLISSLLVGLISYLTVPYLNSIWFETNTMPDLIDALVQWGLCGAFLGWFLNRDKA